MSYLRELYHIIRLNREIWSTYVN